MINHLSGKLVEKNPAFIVIECAGVGYFVNISLYTYSKLDQSAEKNPPPAPASGGQNVGAASGGQNVKIFTHLQINEDAHTLYGFADEDERRLFRNLISVSGVGASTARMILSAMNPPELQECIATEDAVRLKSVKGIGEKTAMRIIVDLKNKVKDMTLGVEHGDSSRSLKMTEKDQGLKLKKEAMSALLTLGFGKNSVDKALDQLLRQQPAVNVEDLIRQALKVL